MDEKQRTIYTTRDKYDPSFVPVPQELMPASPSEARRLLPDLQAAAAGAQGSLANVVASNFANAGHLLAASSPGERLDATIDLIRAQQAARQADAVVAGAERLVTEGNASLGRFSLGLCNN